MALMSEDLFSDNILDEPDELERIQEGDAFEEHNIHQRSEVEGWF